MSSIDQQFVEFIVKSLVSNPDAVVVERRIDEKGVLLELTVDPEDLGRVIGKRGVTAQSLRTLLRALGTKNDARYNLKVIDNGTAAPTDDNAVPVAKNSDTQVNNTSRAVSSSDDDDSDVHADATRDDDEDDNSRLSRTRKELADLDDLDV